MTDTDLSVCVILPASGSGERFGTDPPKQYTSLLEKPLVFHTLSVFHRIPWVKHIILPVKKSYLPYVRSLVDENHYEKVSVIEGSSSRHRSIYQGVLEVKRVCCEPSVIIIQDVVRIFANEETIQQVAMAAKTHGAAGVTRPLVSTVISADSDGFLQESLDRSKYCASEMPQGFLFDIILRAYEKSTDDDFDHGTECLLLAMKYTGTRAKLIHGPDNLWKVTYKKDLYAAEGVLKENHIKVLMCDTLETQFRDEIHKACKKKNIRVLSDTETRETSNSVVSSCSIKDIPKLLAEYFEKLQQNGVDQYVVKPCMIFLNCNCEAEDQSEFRKLCQVLGKQYKDTGILYGITIQELETCLKKVAEVVASLFWNRDVTLSGQVFEIT